MEQYLEHLASIRPHDFPDRDANYFHRFSIAKDYIAQNYYRGAGAGLAAGTGTRYTHHDIDHVDDVFMAIGNLIGLSSTDFKVAADSQSVKTAPYQKLQPYEIYLILLAALVHDAGNARERQGHELLTGKILGEIQDSLKMSPLERRLVANIARAHGGRTADGDKDTIRKAITTHPAVIWNMKIDARALAALIRFADELSENPRRADQNVFAAGSGSPGSALHHLYCMFINPTITPGEVRLAFDVDSSHLGREYDLEEGGKSRKMLLLNYIFDRLEKAELERQYCNAFLGAIPRCDRFIVIIAIFHEDEEIIRQDVELTDIGYPNRVSFVKDRFTKCNSEELRNRFSLPVEAV